MNKTIVNITEACNDSSISNKYKVTLSISDKEHNIKAVMSFDMYVIDTEESGKLRETEEKTIIKMKSMKGVFSEAVLIENLCIEDVDTETLKIVMNNFYKTINDLVSSLNYKATHNYIQIYADKNEFNILNKTLIRKSEYNTFGDSAVIIDEQDMTFGFCL